MRRQKRGGKVREMAFHKAKQRATINKESLKMLVPMLTYIFFLSYWWKKSFQSWRKSGKQERRGKKEREKKEKEKQKERRGKERKIAFHKAKQIATLNKASLNILVLMLTYIVFPSY